MLPDNFNFNSSGDIDRGAWRHQALSWTNVDLLSVRSSDLHSRAVSEEILHPSMNKISLKIIYRKFHPNVPGFNSLTTDVLLTFLCPRYSITPSKESDFHRFSFKSLTPASPISWKNTRSLRRCASLCILEKNKSWWRHQMETFSA